MTFARLKFYAAAIGAAIVAVSVAFLRGMARGKSIATTGALKRRIGDAQKAKDVRDEINDMGRDDRRRDLDKWMRDNDGM